MDKLPPLNLTLEEVQKTLGDPEVQKRIKESFKKLDEAKPTPRPYFLCDMCRDTGMVLVCGGPNRPCPCCGPRY